MTINAYHYSLKIIYLRSFTKCQALCWALEIHCELADISLFSHCTYILKEKERQTLNNYLSKYLRTIIYVKKKSTGRFTLGHLPPEAAICINSL